LNQLLKVAIVISLKAMRPEKKEWIRKEPFEKIKLFPISVNMENNKNKK
jgi:hypothetical protein